MTLEDLHALAATAQTRGRALKRRLTLLQPILTQMPESATNAYNKTKRYNREFWTNFLTPCTAMELAGWRFDLLHDAHNDLVEGILAGLDGIVQVAEASISEEHQAMRFPRLEILAGTIREARETDKPLIELVKPDNADEFLALLNSLAHIMTYNKDTSLPPSEATRISPKNKPLLAPLIYNLFSTLSLHWRCTSVCKSSHKAALALNTNRTYSSNDDSSASFTLLLRKPKSADSMIQWLETSVTVRRSPVKPAVGRAVRFVEAEPKQSKRKPEINLCGMTKQPNISRINLNVDGESLLCHSQTEVNMTIFQEGEPVSFNKSFLEDASELHFKGKICLAVVLSFSFLDFCGRPWFPGGWKKDNLYLMQTGHNLSLQPFLVTEFKGDKKEPSAQVTIAIWEAKLLDHGILLMEIFQQDCFPEPLKQAGKSSPTLKRRKEMAKTWFDSINWDLYEQWSRAVEACINGTIIDSLNISSMLAAQETPQLLSEESLDETFAQFFYQSILAPLEADFASQWPKEDPDKVISTLKIPYVTKTPKPPSSRQGTSLRPRITARLGSHSRTASPRMRTLSAIQLPQRPSRPQSRLSASNSFVAEDNQGRFFDATDFADRKEIQSASEWFGYFDKLDDKLPRRSRSQAKRIRIGVLDTGIDLKNTYISQKSNRIRCWPPDDNHHDNDGHGTHVAYLLLRLTKHADLRICKITESASINDVNIKRIAEAIVHFCQEGEDHVDILTLSFGFPRYDDVLKPINDAIRKARDNGIIIFAAAGNEGGNAGAFWPASLHETGDVIRINSSDGKGSRSGFNPSPAMGRWIYTLGQGVPSCQVTVDTDEVIYRSGSSFASPIAAAIAAIILGVVDHADASQYPADLAALRPRLRTRLGMERVLCETCVQDGQRNSHFYLTPWFFFQPGERVQIHRILNILTHIPG